MFGSIIVPFFTFALLFCFAVTGSRYANIHFHVYQIPFAGYAHPIADRGRND